MVFFLAKTNKNSNESKCFEFQANILLKIQIKNLLKISYRLMTLPYLNRKPTELMTELHELVYPPGSLTTDNLHLFLPRLPFDLTRQHTEKKSTDPVNSIGFALNLDRDLEASRNRYRGYQDSSPQRPHG